MTQAENSAISRHRVGDIMTKSVRTASPSATLREVAEMMRDEPTLAQLAGELGAAAKMSDRLVEREAT